MTLNLDGLIPATVLPMHEDGSIDEPALRSYIGWVADQGPVALAINVDTGEGPHLTLDEKVRVIRIVRDVTDLPIVAGLAGPSTDAAVRQATDFRTAGADALLVFPIPAYLSEPLDVRVPVAYHEAIAQVGLPLILFQLQPALAGLNFEPDTLRARKPAFRYPSESQKRCGRSPLVRLGHVGSVPRTERAAKTGKERPIQALAERGAHGKRNY
jgi:4-hydroxy-tetrahydrodipicolinate synthase